MRKAFPEGKRCVSLKAAIFRFAADKRKTIPDMSYNRMLAKGGRWQSIFGRVLLVMVLVFSGVFAVDLSAAEQAALSGEGEKETMESGRSLSSGSDEKTEVTDEFDAFAEFNEYADDTEGIQTETFDPLSGYNRAVTIVNDRLYYWVLKPVARGYKWVVPEPVRQSVNCFFVNLGFPARFVNNLLQLKLQRSGVEAARFVINSTVGVAGLWDPAQVWLELPVYEEDFGQTLGHYGLGGGFHVVWPFFGPSNVRDSCGRVVDLFLSPTHYLEDDEAALCVSALETTNKTSLHIGQYEAMTDDAMDLYILLRDAYEQNRNKKVEE